MYSPYWNSQAPQKVQTQDKNATMVAVREHGDSERVAGVEEQAKG